MARSTYDNLVAISKAVPGYKPPGLTRSKPSAAPPRPAKLFDLLLPYQRTFATSPQRHKLWIASRQIGKSFTLAYMLDFMALSRKDGLSLCISTGARAASEIIRKCVQFAEAVKLLSKGAITYTSSFDAVKFSNGSRVVSLPSNDPEKLRGYTIKGCCVIDEAAYISHLDQVMQAIGPTLTRDPTSQLLLASTPAGANGPFYEMWQQALADPDGWHTQSTTIYDAVADGLKVDIEDLKKLCPDPDAFAQEYECKFSAEQGALIDTSLLEFFTSPPVPFVGSYYGMDIGRHHDRSGVAVGQLGTDGVLYITELKALQEMPFKEQFSVVRHYNAIHRFRKGFIDGTGIGLPFCEQCHDEISTLLEPFIWTQPSKVSAYENFRSLVFQHKVKFQESFRDAIIADVQNVSRIVTDDGKVRFDAARTSDGHSDLCSATVLACEALRTAHSRPTHLVSSFTPSSIF